MTVKQTEDITILEKNLEARNKEVAKSFLKITEAVRQLLQSFDMPKYRTYIFIEHSKSGKQTNLITEFACYFVNITLTMNKQGYSMIYLTYDEEFLARFGARLYNRTIRALFKHTMFEATKHNIEDSVRVNNPASIQTFFINRLANGSNDFISIEVEPHQTN